jgi:predicted NBD/HSP70 family sugar kinase
VIEAFDEISVLLGVAIKNMINIFAPDYVLIGGEALEFRDLFLKKAILIARENSFGDLGDDVVIDIDDMGEVAWVQGVILNLIEKEVFQVDGRGNTYEV